MRGEKLAGAAVVAAVLVTAQVGFISYRQTGHTRALRQQLAELKQKSEREEAQLSRKLESANVRTQRLRLELEDFEHDNSLLEEELDVMRGAMSVYQDRASALAGVLREERPFLEIHLEPEAALARIVAVATNPGTRRVDIVEARGLVWLDGRVDNAGDRIDSIAISPGEESEFFTFELLGDEPGRVARGEARLRAALCFVYRSRLNGAAPWVGEYWFEYQPQLRTAAVLQQRSFRFVDDEACALESGGALFSSD